MGDRPPRLRHAQVLGRHDAGQGVQVLERGVPVCRVELPTVHQLRGEGPWSADEDNNDVKDSDATFAFDLSFHQAGDIILQDTTVYAAVVELLLELEVPPGDAIFMGFLLCQRHNSRGKQTQEDRGIYCTLLSKVRRVSQQLPLGPALEKYSMRTQGRWRWLRPPYSTCRDCSGHHVLFKQQTAVNKAVRSAAAPEVHVPPTNPMEVNSMPPDDESGLGASHSDE